MTDQTAKAKEIPAIGMSFTQNLGGDRQMVLQGYFPHDLPDTEVNGLLDRLRRLMERQKASCDIPAHELEIVKLEKTMLRFEQDYEGAQREHDRAQAKRAVEYAEYEKAKDSNYQAGYEEHRGSNRKGGYEPRGHIATSIRQCEAAMEAKKGEIDRANQDRAVQVQQIEASRIRFREDIAERRAKIVVCQSLVNGDENPGGA